MALLPLWFKGLTPELQTRAETTLGETSHAKAKALVDFRRLINEQGDIYSRLDEVFLLRFLRTKKYDVQKAFRVYRNYYHFQSKQRGKFTGFRPSDVKGVIDMNNILYVPYRVPPGSHVAIFRMGSFDVSKATAHDLVATVFMIGEMILDTEATQVCGGIIIIDAEGLTLQHYRQFVNLQFLTLILNLIQFAVKSPPHQPQKRLIADPRRLALDNGDRCPQQHGRRESVLRRGHPGPENSPHCGPVCRGRSEYHIALRTAHPTQAGYSGSEQRRRISRVVLHPEFDNDTKENDIAVLKFEPELNFLQTIQPIGLPDHNSSDRFLLPGQKGLIPGWGYNYTMYMFIPAVSYEVANVLVEPGDRCAEACRRQGLSSCSTPKTFCADYPEGVDACMYRGAPPMVLYAEETERHTLA